MEQGLEARSSNTKETFILFPLCPAAPRGVHTDEPLLLLSPPPPLRGPLLFWLKVLPFGSLLWVRHQRNGIISRDDLTSPSYWGGGGGWGSSLSLGSQGPGVASYSTSHGSVKVAAPFVPSVLGAAPRATVPNIHSFRRPSLPIEDPEGSLRGPTWGYALVSTASGPADIFLFSAWGIAPDLCLKTCSHLSLNDASSLFPRHTHTGKSAQGPFTSRGFVNNSLQTSCYPTLPIRPPQRLFLLGPALGPPPRIRATAPAFPALETLPPVVLWSQICCVSLRGLDRFSEFLGFRPGASFPGVTRCLGMEAVEHEHTGGLSPCCCHASPVHVSFTRSA